MSEQDPQQVSGPQGHAEQIRQPAAPPTAQPSVQPIGAPVAAASGPGAGAYGYPVAPPVPDAGVAVDPRRRTRRRRAIVGGSAAAVIAAALIVGAAVRPATTQAGTTATAADDRAPWSWAQGGYGYPGRDGFTPGRHGAPGSSSAGPSSPGSSSSGSSASGTTPTSAATAATTAQQVGVVTVTSALGYENATSAGTGMILSADGLVLTNNHVVESATSIQVTVESTGQTYTATVLGTDKKADVALLKLQDASGLTPVTFDTNGVTSGEAVTAIGNAEGTGSLVAAAGTVTATDQTMTASTDSASAETLSGLIQFSAAVVSGDSGGPVLDAAGQVVGITTAASSGPGATVAYAIDIHDAMAIATQIEKGQGSSDVVIGYPAFLGVSIGSSTQAGLGRGDTGASTGTIGGATITGVIAGTPAAGAGMVAGDTITKVGSTTIGSTDQLSTVLAGHKPGDKVTVTWTSTSTGVSHTATVTLAKGPVA